MSCCIGVGGCNAHSMDATVGEKRREVWSLATQVRGNGRFERQEGRGSSSQVCIRIMEGKLMLELFEKPRLRSWDRRECVKMTS